METGMRKIGATNIEVKNFPRTLDEIKKLQPFEFQNGVNDKLYAHPNPKKGADMSIDGYLIDGSPVQVKQSENLGRNAVDNFESAMRRIGKKTGVIVAFSFGRGAREEVAKVKNEQGLIITLKPVQEILDET